MSSGNGDVNKKGYAVKISVLQDAIEISMIIIKMRHVSYGDVVKFVAGVLAVGSRYSLLAEREWESLLEP